MKYEIDIENQAVTTWWHIEDIEYHCGNKPTGESYYWSHMIDEYEYTEEKHRLHEPEYDEDNGRLCCFWLQVEMPKYLWHLYNAGMPQEEDKWENEVYFFCDKIINDWVETQRIIHRNKNKALYKNKKPKLPTLEDYGFTPEVAL